MWMTRKAVRKERARVLVCMCTFISAYAHVRAYLMYPPLCVHSSTYWVSGDHECTMLSLLVVRGICKLYVDNSV